jgi:putative hydrolase of the HAD superfamily
MIRAVFFDLDGTLYDRDATILRMAEEQFETFRDELGVEKSVFLERLVELDGHGQPRTPRLHHVLAESLGLGAGVGDKLEAYFRSHYPNLCKLSSENLATLKTLRERGKTLGLITNGPTEWQSRKIERMGLAPLFDAVLISEAEGVRKPDPQIFERALERCGVRADESMFVGDHPEIDIKGAVAAGLVPVWKAAPYWQVADDVLRIDQLSDLLELLDGG